ncbi:recombinase family protein [Vagococcus coleopterorum]|uniref:Recombinase family protein n=1 Tax=Vagococcus coleopterorum TaxID=2714946 RepID=A0A6G8AMX3_9ENTE|nr:recombinase family protein [Vagococcus coleopterorum]QIL46346.1 recombinase family protein [Vagococcus coleopterorum]
MSTIGYAYTTKDKTYLSAQLEALGKNECDRIVLETDSFEQTSHPHVELEAAVAEMTKGDTLVVFELICLGKSIIQLADFISSLNDKGIKLVILSKPAELAHVDSSTYSLMVGKMAKMEKEIIRERTSRGLEVARQNGRIGGRPRISQETIEKIQTLYSDNKYTLRQIAEECDISLGTAYKYTQAR